MAPRSLPFDRSTPRTVRCASAEPPSASDGKRRAQRRSKDHRRVAEGESGERQEEVRIGALGTDDSEDQEAEGGEEEAVVGEEQGERRKGGTGRAAAKRKRAEETQPATARGEAAARANREPSDGPTRCDGPSRREPQGERRPRPNPRLDDISRPEIKPIDTMDVFLTDRKKSLEEAKSPSRQVQVDKFKTGLGLGGDGVKADDGMKWRGMRRMAFA